MTSEILAEQELTIDGDFDELMERQRGRGRAQASAGAGTTGDHAGALLAELAGAGPRTTFTGYETEHQHTTVGALRSVGDGVEPGPRYLVKLAESPFYAPGGGQIADVGHDRMRAGRLPRARRRRAARGRRPGA